MSPTRARRWEYKTLRPTRGETKKEAEDPQAELNEYGDEGWELAGTVDDTGGGTKFLVFKRPAEAADEVPDATGGVADATDGVAEEDSPP